LGWSSTIIEDGIVSDDIIILWIPLVDEATSIITTPQLYVDKVTRGHGNLEYATRVRESPDCLIEFDSIAGTKAKYFRAEVRIARVDGSVHVKDGRRISESD
jgi:hypothetical protein